MVGRAETFKFAVAFPDVGWGETTVALC